MFRRGKGKPAAGGNFFGVFRERSIGFAGILEIEGGNWRGKNPPAAEGGRKKSTMLQNV